MVEFNPSSTVSRVVRQVSSDLAGEAVILHIDSGLYYGLNSVGQHVWNALVEPHTVDELATSVRATFQVDEETCRRDLLRLLDELCRAGLVRAVG